MMESKAAFERLYTFNKVEHLMLS